jgi:hypothetical protein
MFYFALKIKRPEVADGTYFRPTRKGVVLRLQRGGKAMCLIAGGLERLTLDECSQEVTAIKGDIDDKDQVGGQSCPQYRYAE